MRRRWILRARRGALDSPLDRPSRRWRGYGASFHRALSSHVPIDGTWRHKDGGVLRVRHAGPGPCAAPGPRRRRARYCFEMRRGRSSVVGPVAGEPPFAFEQPWSARDVDLRSGRAHSLRTRGGAMRRSMLRPRRGSRRTPPVPPAERRRRARHSVPRCTEDFSCANAPVLVVRCGDGVSFLGAARSTTRGSSPRSRRASSSSSA